ncbi:MAG: heparinase II/III family protein [Planctomycetes bacterium]|nr:heparinase II/III family protein [Planctomycetota bacterium]
MNRGLLATRRELTELRNRVDRRPFDAIYETLRKRCALVLESKPITETDWRGRHLQGMWGPALTAARDCQGRIFDLIICHHIEPNTAYRDRAIEEMKLLAGWSTWIDPCHDHAKADLCTAECCTTMAVALDWLEEDLTEIDRLRCMHALREKGVAAYAAAVADGAWWYNCYHNWNAVMNSGCGLAALALSDEDPQALESVHRARIGLKVFFDALGREGGWDEGIGYWGYALRYLLLFGEAMDRLMDDQTIFHQRGMETAGLFGVYFSPRGHSASFGDSQSVPLYGVLYGLVRRYGIKETCWWLDRYALHRDVSSTGWSDAGLGLLFRPMDQECEPAPNLSPVKVYNEIGWAAICDEWPHPNLYVSIKTGDLSAHHSHLDMNSIQLQIDGEMLLADLGNPPFTHAYYFTPNRYTFYQAQAQGHNTLSVDGRGHRIDAQGQIVEAEQGDNYRWVTASAGTALGEAVRFNRHVILVVAGPKRIGHTLIVFDELVNAVAEKSEACWHTFGQLKFRGHAGRIIGQQSELHFRIAADSKFSCAGEEHSVGSLTESVLRIAMPATNRLALVSAFSREPIRSIRIKRNSRGEVTLDLPTVNIHFKGGRQHLRLDKIALK